MSRHSIPTVSSLQKMSSEELDALYLKSAIGTIPVGDTRGTSIFFAGTVLSLLLAPLVRLIAWQGKIFDPTTGTLLNSILPFGIVCAIQAKVYMGPSRLVPGSQTIVLDYKDAAFPFSTIRDEIREVAPGLYLGPVFIRSYKVLYFVLECER